MAETTVFLRLRDLRNMYNYIERNDVSSLQYALNAGADLGWQGVCYFLLLYEC